MGGRNYSMAVAQKIIPILNSTPVSPPDGFEWVEFKGGKYYLSRQIAGATYRLQYQPGNTPSAPKFVANYATSVDADSSAGSPTGTAFGTAAIVGGKLDLTGGNNSGVDYAGAGNADFRQVGCINMKVIPNFTGLPDVDTDFMPYWSTTSSDGSTVNEMGLFQSVGDGSLQFFVYDQNGSLLCDVTIPGFACVAGTMIEIEINYDLNSGFVWALINGVMAIMAVITAGIRSAIGLLRVGNIGDTLRPVDIKVERVEVYDQVQHREDYTPS